MVDGIDVVVGGVDVVVGGVVVLGEVVVVGTSEVTGVPATFVVVVVAAAFEQDAINKAVTTVALPCLIIVWPLLAGTLARPHRLPLQQLSLYIAIYRNRLSTRDLSNHVT